MNALKYVLGNNSTINVHDILYLPASMSKCGSQSHDVVAINSSMLAKFGYTGYFEIQDDPYFRRK